MIRSSRRHCKAEPDVPSMMVDGDLETEDEEDEEDDTPDEEEGVWGLCGVVECIDVDDDDDDTHGVFVGPNCWYLTAAMEAKTFMNPIRVRVRVRVRVRRDGSQDVYESWKATDYCCRVGLRVRTRGLELGRGRGKIWK